MAKTSFTIPAIQVIALIALTSAISLISSASGQTRTVKLTPGANIQTAVDAAPAGTAFVLEAGVYRMQSVIPKSGDTFTGVGSVVLNGSALLQFAPDPAGNGLYVASASANSDTSGTCDKSHPLCIYDQDLFIDDSLQIVQDNAQNLRQGSWYFDRPHNRVYIPVNPQGHKIELAMTNYAFSGKATNVQIRHLTIEKYATPGHTGAVGGYHGGAKWIVDHVESRWNHGIGICLGGASEISHSFVHNNGQMGVCVIGGANAKVINNEISWNNYANYSTQWEAGGSKFWATTNLLVQSNNVHDNNGGGLWCDTDNIGTIYENNTVVNNSGGGISHEISYQAIIRNNIVKENGNGAKPWFGNAQIVIRSSPNVEVYGNTVEVGRGGASGIAIINEQRGAGAHGSWISANDYVHNNTIIYLGPTGASGMENNGGAAPEGSRFDSNHYIIKNGGNVHWRWLKNKDWQGIRSEGQEQHGICDCPS